jgi:hypothetical protein
VFNHGTLRKKRVLALAGILIGVAPSPPLTD